MGIEMTDDQYRENAGWISECIVQHYLAEHPEHFLYCMGKGYTRWGSCNRYTTFWSNWYGKPLEDGEVNDTASTLSPLGSGENDGRVAGKSCKNCNGPVSHNAPSRRRRLASSTLPTTGGAIDAPSQDGAWMVICLAILFTLGFLVYWFVVRRPG